MRINICRAFALDTALATLRTGDGGNYQRSQLRLTQI
jgi:hypothetical protein